MATPLGFEPRITPPKGAVLPKQSNLFDEIAVSLTAEKRRAETCLLGQLKRFGASPEFRRCKLVTKRPNVLPEIPAPSTQIDACAGPPIGAIRQQFANICRFLSPHDVFRRRYRGLLLRHQIGRARQSSQSHLGQPASLPAIRTGSMSMCGGS